MSNAGSSYQDRAGEAWAAWLEDNKDRFPEDKLKFIKSVYADAYEDGKSDRQHGEVMSCLQSIRRQLLKTRRDAQHH